MTFVYVIFSEDRQCPTKQYSYLLQTFEDTDLNLTLCSFGHFIYSSDYETGQYNNIKVSVKRVDTVLNTRLTTYQYCSLTSALNDLKDKHLDVNKVELVVDSPFVT